MTEIDLTPRESQPDTSSTRSWRNIVIVSALLAVAGFVVFQALTSARVYYLNVDEAVAQQGELGTDEIRLQGTVVGEPASADDGALIFTVVYGGASAEVRHIGPEPTDLFQDGEQVLSVGRWQGNTFQSEQIIVKHSEEYVEDNPNRVDYELEDTVSDASGSSQSE